MNTIKGVYAETASSFSALKVPVSPVSSSAPLKGKIAYDTTTNQFKIANGAIWLPVATKAVGGVLSGSLPDPDFVNGAITASNIANGTITNTQLANTGVVAGTYGDSTHVGSFTVNSKGQITSATSIAIVGGTVTQLNTGTGLTGGPITTTGTVSLANTAVTPGTYGSADVIPIITANQQGQITGITTVAKPLTHALISTYKIVEFVPLLFPGDIVPFNGTIVQQTGFMEEGGIFVADAAGKYSITFCSLAFLGGQFMATHYQMLLNETTVLAYCVSGNDGSAGPVMIAYVGTARMTVNITLAQFDNIRIKLVEHGIGLLGDENGPATILTVIKLS